MKRVLIIATSHKTRGGITSVIKAHEQGEQWKKFHCKWISTHRDDNKFIKIFYFLRAVFIFLLYLPFIDLVHIHFSEYSSARRKMFFAKTSKIFGKKVILHFHAPDPDNTYLKHPRFYSKLFSLADSIIVLSEKWKDSLLSSLPIEANKVKVIFNPCPRVTLTEKIVQKPYILYAGTLNQRKGYYDLINAFSAIASKHPEWKLILAGNGEIHKGKELVFKNNISDQVEFRGWVVDSDKDLLFKEASIFCLPSYAEGFPMAVLDAWAYGLPVITTPVGGIPDIVVNGANALLFSPGDVKHLSSLLDSLMENESSRLKLSKASLEMSQTTFNIDYINQQIGELYDSLLNE